MESGGIECVEAPHPVVPCVHIGYSIGSAVANVLG